jgi:hypothetical protein
MTSRTVSEVCTLVAAERVISAGSRPAARAAAAILACTCATFSATLMLSSPFFLSYLFLLSPYWVITLPL